MVNRMIESEVNGWYDNEDGEDDISEDGEYNFLNGQISVKIASYNEITLDEYNVLIKYI